jgi:hypothetical protein
MCNIRDERCPLILYVLQWLMMTVLDSQAHTKTRNITSARTSAKRNLMKIHEDIHELPVILLLNLVGRRAERDCQRTRHFTFLCRTKGFK